MALDAATVVLLAEMPQAGIRPLPEMSPKGAREFVATTRPQLAPPPEMLATTEHRVEVTGGTIPVRVLTPNEHPTGILVWYHGGGWVLGSIADCDLLGRRLSKRTGCVVVLVGYRLAPEYRFPTAVEDSYKALLWVDHHLERIAGRRVPIVVAGDSAGGNLATVMTVRSRDLGGPTIDMQVLIYPVTDCDFDNVSYLDPENALILSRDAMIWFWDHYAPDPTGRIHPDASPLRISDMSNLPRAVVITAEHDVLRTEGESYATRLVDSGVPVQQQRFKGQMHGFFTMVDLLPSSEAGIDYVVEAVGRHLAIGVGLND